MLLNIIIKVTERFRLKENKKMLHKFVPKKSLSFITVITCSTKQILLLNLPLNAERVVKKVVSRSCNSLLHLFKNECFWNPFTRWFVSIVLYTTFTLLPYYFPLSYMVNETEWEKRWPTRRGGALSIARSHCSQADLPQLSCIHSTRVFYTT